MAQPAVAGCAPFAPRPFGADPACPPQLQRRRERVFESNGPDNIVGLMRTATKGAVSF